MNKRGDGSNHCSGHSLLSPCAAWLIAIFGSVLFVAALVLGTKLNRNIFLAASVMAMGATALFEVARHLWTDRHGPSTGPGASRVLALWFGLWVLMYATMSWPQHSAQMHERLPPEPLPQSPSPPANTTIQGSENPPDRSYRGSTPAASGVVQTVAVANPTNEVPQGSDGGISLIATVLAVVLAVTTLVATKVAADAKGEVQAVRETLEKSKDIAFLADSAAFDLKLQKLFAWRMDIMFGMNRFGSEPDKAARLDALDKCVKALKVPLEVVPLWGTSAVNHLDLAERVQHANALLSATPDLSSAIRLLLGYSGGEDHLRELGVALGRFLEHLRGRNPHATVSELDAWGALARLSQQLRKL